MKKLVGYTSKLFRIVLEYIYASILTLRFLFLLQFCISSNHLWICGSLITYYQHRHRPQNTHTDQSLTQSGSVGCNTVVDYLCYLTMVTYFLYVL